MKKLIIRGCLLFVVGILLGMGICHNHYTKITPDNYRDTTYIYEKVPYTRLDLGKMAVRLSVPELSIPNMVYVRADSATIIYRDSIRYITLPREYYYTKAKDVEIWYSGIDSTIDSLNVVVKNTNIIQNEKVTKLVRHTNHLRFGVEASYCTTLSLPIYFEYEKMLHRNVGLRAGFFYDLPTRMYGLRVGANVQIGW